MRRDLAALGNLGQRGVGYDAAGLAMAIRRTLGIDRPWRAVLVGVGNLARALLRYRGFRDQGFLIVGLFDSDPAKIGQVVEGLTVEPTSAIPARVPALRAELGVLTVPSEPAQAVADALTAAGVRGLLELRPGASADAAGGPGGDGGPGDPVGATRLPGATPGRPGGRG